MTDEIASTTLQSTQAAWTSGAAMMKEAVLHLCDGSLMMLTEGRALGTAKDFLRKLRSQITDISTTTQPTVPNHVIEQSPLHKVLDHIFQVETVRRIAIALCEMDNYDPEELSAVCTSEKVCQRWELYIQEATDLLATPPTPAFTPDITTTTDLVVCQNWRHSHPDTTRWRAYYEAFELKHGRVSTDHEFDPELAQIIDRIMNVVKLQLNSVTR